MPPGDSIVFFAEGGYNNTEEKLINRLFAGPWLLAKECGTEVVPIISFNDYDSKDIYISVGRPIRLDLYEKEEAMRIMKEVASDSDMENRWGQFRKKNDFVGDIMYKQLMDALMETTNKLFHTSIDRSSYEN